jgi:hypothetical protein
LYRYAADAAAAAHWYGVAAEMGYAKVGLYKLNAVET